MEKKLPDGTIYLDTKGNVKDNQGIVLFKSGGKRSSQREDILAGKPKNKNLGLGLIGIAVLTLANIIFWNFRESQYADRERSYLFQEIQERADIDKNGTVNHEEWREVYREIGRQYSWTSSLPIRDLSIKDLEFYLSRKYR